MTDTHTTCRYCGEIVESAKADVDWCRNCHYLGLHEAERFTALENIDGGVYHTGGGVFVIDFATADGHVWASDTGGGGLPETVDGPWFVCHYYEDEEGEGLVMAESTDEAGLRALVDAARARALLNEDLAEGDWETMTVTQLQDLMDANVLFHDALGDDLPVVDSTIARMNAAMAAYDRVYAEGAVTR